MYKLIIAPLIAYLTKVYAPKTVLRSACSASVASRRKNQATVAKGRTSESAIAACTTSILVGPKNVRTSPAEMAAAKTAKKPRINMGGRRRAWKEWSSTLPTMTTMLLRNRNLAPGVCRSPSLKREPSTVPMKRLHWCCAIQSLTRTGFSGAMSAAGKTAADRRAATASRDCDVGNWIDLPKSMRVLHVG